MFEANVLRLIQISTNSFHGNNRFSMDSSNLSHIFFIIDQENNLIYHNFFMEQRKEYGCYCLYIINNLLCLDVRMHENYVHVINVPAK